MNPHVCLKCRKSFKREGTPTEACPECSAPLHVLHHNFSPPKASDKTSWKLVEFLISQGFDFSGWVKKKGTPEGIGHRPGYPRTMLEAKEFIKLWEPFQKNTQTSET